MQAASSAVGEWQWAAYRAGGASDPLFAYKIQSTVSSIRVPVSHSHTQQWGRASRGLTESSCSPLSPARSAGPGPGGHLEAPSSPPGPQLPIAGQEQEEQQRAASSLLPWEGGTAHSPLPSATSHS